VHRAHADARLDPRGAGHESSRRPTVVNPQDNAGRASRNDLVEQRLQVPIGRYAVLGLGCGRVSEAEAGMPTSASGRRRTKQGDGCGPQELHRGDASDE
jgi:hypothetical protein